LRAPIGSGHFKKQLQVDACVVDEHVDFEFLYGLFLGVRTSSRLSITFTAKAATLRFYFFGSLETVSAISVTITSAPAVRD
jgi:hypothetical protein